MPLLIIPVGQGICIITISLLGATPVIDNLPDWIAANLFTEPSKLAEPILHLNSTAVVGGGITTGVTVLSGLGVQPDVRIEQATAA